jgi:hypothetical protein
MDGAPGAPVMSAEAMAIVVQLLQAALAAKAADQPGAVEPAGVPIGASAAPDGAAATLPPLPEVVLSRRVALQEQLVYTPASDSIVYDGKTTNYRVFYRSR